MIGNAGNQRQNPSCNRQRDPDQQASDEIAFYQLPAHASAPGQPLHGGVLSVFVAVSAGAVPPLKSVAYQPFPFN